MKGRGEVAFVAEVAPFLERRPVPVQGKEVLKVVEGELEVGNTGGLLRVMISAMVVVSVIEVEIRPDLDGCLFIVFPSRLILLFQFTKTATFGNCLLRSDQPQRRLEGAAHQWLLIEKALQPLKVSPLGLSFANDDVAGA